MLISRSLQQLIAQCATLWAAEAEVFATYWDWAGRTDATDKLWLLRQMYKELHDGVKPQLKKLQQGIHGLDSAVARDEVRSQMQLMRQEFEHYAAFAEVYESLCAHGEPCPTLAELERAGAWPENDVLMRMRAAHCDQYGPLGERSRCFTEGGYCTLFSEGMKLRDRGGIDARIAIACAEIFDDEFEHMLSGIADLASPEHDLTHAEWQVLGRLTSEQLRQRVRMRNAQFSHPVGTSRLQTIIDGACAPLPFDFVRAFGDLAPADKL